MSIEENKALVRRYYDLWNGLGSLAELSEVLAEDVIDHMAYEDQQTGLAGHREFIALWRTAFPDLHSTIDDLIAEDGRVAIRWHAIGTHLGHYHGLAPTGRAIQFEAITILHIRDGRITDSKSVCALLWVDKWHR